MYGKEKVMDRFLNVCLLPSSDFIQDNRIKAVMYFFFLSLRENSSLTSVAKSLKKGYCSERMLKTEEEVEVNR